MIDRVLIWIMNFLLVAVMVVFIGSGLKLEVLLFLPFFGISQPLLTLAYKKMTSTVPGFFKKMTTIYWLASVICLVAIVVYYSIFSFKGNYMLNVVLLAGFPLGIAFFQQVNLTLQTRYW